MKKLLYLTLALVSVVLMGCEKKEVGDLGLQRLLIVKFAQPEYKEYVISTLNADGNATLSSSHLRGTWANRPHQLPYYELVDDYLLVDWRIGAELFRRDSTNVLINMPWTDLSNWNHVWKPSQFIVSSDTIISEKWLFDMSYLDLYVNGGSFEDMIIYSSYETTHLIYQSDEEIKEIEYYHDKRYAQWVDVLNSLIESVGLDTVNQELIKLDQECYVWNKENCINQAENK